MLEKERSVPEVGAAFATLVIEAGHQRLDKRSQMSVIKRRPQRAVGVLVERVQVAAQRSREQHRILTHTHGIH